MPHKGIKSEIAQVPLSDFGRRSCAVRKPVEH